MNSGPQKWLAEFIGTFAVIFVSAGAVCLNQFLLSRNLHSFGAPGIALAYGLSFGAMAAFLAPIYRGRSLGGKTPARDGSPCTQGHFNPAISVAFWGVHRLATFEMLAFCAMQLLGATAAAYVLRGIVPAEIWRAAALGTPDLRDGVTRAPAMLMEGVSTFFLIMTLFAVSKAGRTFSKIAAIAAGLAVAAGALLSLPFTGGSLNPARAFGPALASHHWTNHGVYWVGPIAGGVLAAWIFDAVVPAIAVRPAHPSLH